MKLNELKIGQVAKVIQIAEGSASLRIMELGIVIGSTIALKSQAPLGDPKVYQLGDAQISMRLSESSLVEIEII
jgi:Fe2+ transport system protein FeoA